MKACIKNMVGTLALVAVVPMTAVASSQTAAKPAQRSLLVDDPFAFLEGSSFDFYQNYLTTGFWFSPGWTFYGVPAANNQPVVVNGPVQIEEPVVASAPAPQQDGFFYEFPASSASSASEMEVTALVTPEPEVVIAQNQSEPPPLSGLQISPIAVTPKPRSVLLTPPTVVNQPIISNP